MVEFFSKVHDVCMIAIAAVAGVCLLGIIALPIVALIQNI